MGVATMYKVYENRCGKSVYTTSSLYDAEEFVRQKSIRNRWTQNPYKEVFEILKVRVLKQEENECQN